MALADIIEELQDFIGAISKDLEKVRKGNKTAAQRVRTMTIQFEKVALTFRKKSMADVKSGKLKKKKPKSKAKKFSTK